VDSNRVIAEIGRGLARKTKKRKHSTTVQHCFFRSGLSFQWSWPGAISALLRIGESYSRSSRVTAVNWYYCMIVRTRVTARSCSM